MEKIKIKIVRKKPLGIFSSILIGLVLAGLFSAVFYAFALPYSPGETTNPSCAPTDANCTVTASAVYSFGSNNFSGTGTFTTTGVGTFGSASNVSQLVIKANASQTNTYPLAIFYKSDGTTELLRIHSDDTTNLFIGTNAGRVNSQTGGGNNGLHNVFIGSNSGYSNTTGAWNTAVGRLSLYSNTTGLDNTAVGFDALYSNTSGSYNLAIGLDALYSNTTGNSNSAIGWGSLTSSTTGIENSAVGADTLNSNTTGYSNTAMGKSVLANSTSGYQNSAIGVEALNKNKTGSGNTAAGYQAGYGVTAQSFSNNSLFGYQSGYVLTTGSNNMLFGYKAGDNLTTGSGNIVIGYDIDAPAVGSTQTLNIGNLIFGTGLDGSGTTLSTGKIGIGTTTPGAKLHIVGNADDEQLVITANATQSNTNPLVKFFKSDGTTELLRIHSDDITNLFIGLNAGRVNSQVGGGENGLYNVFVGSNAGYSNTTGAWNTAVGRVSLYSNTIGGDNTAVGFNALYSNTEGNFNTVVGSEAMYSNTTGGYNTVLGGSALRLNTTGISNIAIGIDTLYSNNGESNIAVGRSALEQNTTGNYNLAIGTNTLYKTKTGLGNTAAGYQAGYGVTNQSFSNNSLFGYQSGFGLSTGGNNTLIGYQAGFDVGTGAGNVLIGYLAGSGSEVRNTSNLLYIANSNTSTPLIYGNFSTSALTINGTMGIGLTPTALLHLKAGTITASTAPLKFTTGVSLTIAEAGAMEFTTDDLYFTITTGPARKGIVLNDGTNLTATRVPYATTNGRLTDAAGFTFDGTTLTAAGLIGPIQISSATGVNLTATNGILTLAGLKTAGFNENLLIDFETTTNNIIFSSGTGAATLFWNGFTHKFTNGSLMYDQSTRFIYQPIGSRFDILNAAGSQFIYIGTSTYHSWYISNAIKLYLTSAGLSVNTGVAATSWLTLGAGTATAGQAPLKFTTGVSNTVAEAGAMEFTTDDLYFTITTGPARKGIVLNDGTNLTATRVPYATTNGRLTDSANLTFSGTNLFTSTLAIGANAANNTFSTSSGGTGTTVMYIGTYTINTTAPSDISVKENITATGYGLADLMKFSIKNFEYKKEYVDEGETQKEHTGLIAQEVETIYPEAVIYRSDNLKAIDYNKLIPLIIKSIQDLALKGVSGSLSDTGALGTGQVEGVETNSFTTQLKSAFVSLGVYIEKGVATVEELVAQKATIKTAKIEGLEMVDKATGEVWCAWISNGEWQKTKGECNAIPTSISTPEQPAVSTEQTTEQTQQAVDQAQQVVQQAQEAVQQAQETANQAQQAANNALETTEQARQAVQEQVQQVVQQAAESADKAAKQAVKEVKNQIKEEVKQELQQEAQPSEAPVPAEQPTEQPAAPEENPASSSAETPGPAAMLEDLIKSSTASLLNSIWQFAKWALQASLQGAVKLVPDGIKSSSAGLTSFVVQDVRADFLQLFSQIKSIYNYFKF